MLDKPERNEKNDRNTKADRADKGSGDSMAKTPQSKSATAEKTAPPAVAAAAKPPEKASQSAQPTPGNKAAEKPTGAKAPERPPAVAQRPPERPAPAHKPTVILVGADKGGVGKTTVTRTILDYLATRGIPRRAFDTEAPKGTLKRFFPDITEIVDVTSAADQMKIFDTISAAEATVIDVRAGLLTATLEALRDIGFMEHARTSNFTFAVFHILGPSIASLEEIADTANFLTDAHHFLVKNFINNTTFFDWDPTTYNSYFNRIKGAQEISIPRLNELACEQVEIAAIPFHTFADNRTRDGQPASYSFVLRGYVRHWLGKVYGEYDRVQLTSLIRHKQKVA